MERSTKLISELVESSENIAKIEFEENYINIYFNIIEKWELNEINDYNNIFIEVSNKDGLVIVKIKRDE